MGFLRFLLALIVVVHHIPQISGNRSFPVVMSYLDAMVAVLIFFIFSGFYMSLVINRKYSNGPNFPGSFYANRALRIFPLYWLTLLLTFIYYVAVRHADRVASISSQQGLFWIGQVFMNMTTLGLDVVPSLGGYTLQLVGPAWSLGSEWLFYLVAPLLVRLGWRRTSLVILVIFAIRFSLYQAGSDRYPFRVLFFPLSLGFFMLGHLAYLMMARLERIALAARITDNKRIGAVAIGAVLIAGLVLHVGSNTDPETPNLWAFYVLMTLAIPIMFTSLQRNPIDKFFGDLTFPLYISHALVVTVVGDFIFGENAQRISAVSLSLIFALILTLLVEMPLERARANFGAWIMRPGQVFPRWLPNPNTGWLQRTALAGRVVVMAGSFRARRDFSAREASLPERKARRSGLH